MKYLLSKNFSEKFSQTDGSGTGGQYFPGRPETCRREIIYQNRSSGSEKSPARHRKIIATQAPYYPKIIAKLSRNCREIVAKPARNYREITEK
jgi:hypothetical protein